MLVQLDELEETLYSPHEHTGKYTNKAQRLNGHSVLGAYTKEIKLSILWRYVQAQDAGKIRRQTIDRGSNELDAVISCARRTRMWGSCT
jgi:hypothetical protein